MERGAAKLAPLRGAQTDAAPFPAPCTDVTARSTGPNCNGNGNGNGNGEVKSNCNCRCAYVKGNGHSNGEVKSNCNCRCAYIKGNGHFKGSATAPDSEAGQPAHYILHPLAGSASAFTATPLTSFRLPFTWRR